MKEVGGWEVLVVSTSLAGAEDGSLAATVVFRER